MYMHYHAMHNEIEQQSPGAPIQTQKKNTHTHILHTNTDETNSHTAVNEVMTFKIHLKLLACNSIHFMQFPRVKDVPKVLFPRTNGSKILT